MKKNENYKLSKVKQLIDLNGDLTNFNLTFKVDSLDGSDFEAIVVDQTTLDNNTSLDYKTAPGTISGSIIADKNVYQNYFLLLRSNNPCECNVNIEVEKIEANPEFLKLEQEILQQEMLQQQQQNERYVQQPTQPVPPPNNEIVEKSENETETKKSKFKLNWKIILAIIVVIALIGVGYYFYRKRKSNQNAKEVKVCKVIENNKPAEVIEVDNTQYLGDDVGDSGDTGDIDDNQDESGYVDNTQEVEDDSGNVDDSGDVEVQEPRITTPVKIVAPVIPSIHSMPSVAVKKPSVLSNKLNSLPKIK
jgi:hypothetical protein